MLFIKPNVTESTKNFSSRSTLILKVLTLRVITRVTILSFFFLIIILFRNSILSAENVNVYLMIPISQFHNENSFNLKFLG